MQLSGQYAPITPKIKSNIFLIFVGLYHLAQLGLTRCFASGQMMVCELYYFEFHAGFQILLIGVLFVRPFSFCTQPGFYFDQTNYIKLEAHGLNAQMMW